MTKQEAGLVPRRPSEVWQPRGGEATRCPAPLSSGSRPRVLADLPLSPTSLTPWSLVSAPGLNPLSYAFLGDGEAAGKGGEPLRGLEQLDPSCILALYPGLPSAGPGRELRSPACSPGLGAEASLPVAEVSLGSHPLSKASRPLWGRLRSV